MPVMPVTLIKPVQPEKADVSMLVTFGGMSSVSNPLPEKALHPIVVTYSGIVILVSPLQLRKAMELIDVTDDGITKLVRPESSKVESGITVRFDGSVTVFKLEQPQNVPGPND